MKFTTAAAVAAFAAGAVAAPNPVPEADANPWCNLPGQPCWKVKRVAEAFAEAIQSSGGVAKRTPESEAGNLPGGAGYASKRAVNELAHLIALTRDAPNDYYKGLGLGDQFAADEGNQKREAAPEPWCWAPGEPCWKAKREAAPEPWCSIPGEPCWKEKREAAPEPWCWAPGEPCWKSKRAADEVIEAIGTEEENPASHLPFHPSHVPSSPHGFAGHGPAWWKREAAPEPWCSIPGEPCWKEKREALAEAEANPWCSIPGEPCWKDKREATPEPWCWAPGEPCWKAKRDLHAIRAVAEGISAGFA